jgi:hypothetical protein
MKLGLALVLLAMVAASDAPRQPSLEDIRGDFAKAEYRAALDKINKVVFSTREMPPVERFELLMMKGECQLQLTDRLGASSSFKAAAKVAGNLGEFAAARATALIIDRSPMGKFNPPFGSGEKPIDIVPADSRKKAMASLQREIWSRSQPAIDAALRANTFPPIEAAGTPMIDAYLLEVAVTGGAQETGKTMRDLGAHAFRLMQADVKRAAWRVEQFNLLANSTEDHGRRRGVHTLERGELRDMLPYLVKIRDRAHDYRSLAARLEGDEQKWASLEADAAEALAAADSLANER